MMELLKVPWHYDNQRFQDALKEHGEAAKRRHYEQAVMKTCYVLMCVVHSFTLLVVAHLFVSPYLYLY